MRVELALLSPRCAVVAVAAAWVRGALTSVSSPPYPSLPLSHPPATRGRYEPTENGTITLLFDNTASWVSTGAIKYTYEVEEGPPGAGGQGGDGKG